MRKSMPPRRSTWTCKVRISGNSYYASFGEYEDGTLGEVWLDASREGTLMRNILAALARMVSFALQCGMPVSDVAESMRGLNFPPNGLVEGSDSVTYCTSVVDWFAQEMQNAYIQQPAKS
jgi:ribonucleoside-diphosphate reductase alpha chain